MPDVQTLCSLSEKNCMPLDVFFNSNKESGHVYLLRTAARYLCNKYNNVFKNNEIKNNNVVASHLDEINIATMLLHKNKALGMSTNNAEELANSIQVFLLTALHGKKHRINLCSKPLCNMKSECL